MKPISRLPSPVYHLLAAAMLVACATALVSDMGAIVDGSQGVDAVELQRVTEGIVRGLLGRHYLDAQQL